MLSNGQRLCSPTELSGILRSDVAIAVSIRLMNTFVEMRRTLTSMAPMMTRLEAVERRQITVLKARI